MRSDAADRDASRPASNPLSDVGDAPLPREVRGFIVLLAMLQGLALWLLSTGSEQGWGWLAGIDGRVCWYTLVLSVPTAMALSVRRLDEARFWQHTALLTVVFLGLAWWAGHSVTGAPALQAQQVLAPFGASLAVALFIAVPYLQCRLQHGRWCAPYLDLFDHAWQNALTLLVMLAFTGICWLVLMLWAGLFKLIGIDWFADLFRQEPFVYLATGTFAGLGVLLGRSEKRPIQLMRRLLFATFTGLLPVLALVALLFVVSLPFTGLQPLWATRSAAMVLMLLVAAMVLFTNAVYQDGRHPTPYPAWLRWLVSAGLASLPVFAVLAGYALWLRIAQYGWTAERLWAVVAAVVLGAHAFGYAWAALWRGGTWLRRLEPVNVAVSLLAIALALAANSPVLDPHRLATASQVERLLSGVTKPADFDVNYLRFDAGRAGYRALVGLQSESLVTTDTELAKRIERAIARQHRYAGWAGEDELRRTAVRDVAAARALIAVAGAAPPEDWWEALIAQKFPAGGCLQPGADCVVVMRDLDRDGVEDALLCDLGQEWAVGCQVHARRAGTWSEAASVMFHGPETAMREALRRGEVTVRPRRWPDLEVAGQRSAVDAVGDEVPEPGPQSPSAPEAEDPAG